MTHAIADAFARAGLALRVEREPLDRGRGLRAVEIVQLDIARRRGAEWFRLFLGHRKNIVAAGPVDAALRQVVLTVVEAGRPFEARIDASVTPDSQARVLRREGQSVVVELFTRSAPQHYLCGRDESHLFIAQLPARAWNVGHAHALLAPDVPADYAGRPRVRQGEWFFFPATAEDAAELERLEVLGYGKRTNAWIAEAARLRRAGRPHVARELRVLKGSAAMPGRRVFVRGDVRHPDHRTLVLPTWHRVLPNRELVDRRARGRRWVD
jgi:hypothetical protein